MARIKASKSTGSGDDGYSHLLEGARLPKSHPATSVYSAQEHLQVEISSFLYYFKMNHQYSRKDLVPLVPALSWLEENLFCVGAYVYSLGQNTSQVFPESFLYFMNRRVDFIADQLGDCQDFLTYQEEIQILLNRIRVATRDCERALATWKSSEDVVRVMYSSPALITFLQQEMAIFNRISAWIWHESRLLAKLRGYPEKHWGAQCTPFPTTLLNHSADLEHAPNS